MSKCLNTCTPHFMTEFDFDDNPVKRIGRKVRKLRREYRIAVKL